LDACPSLIYCRCQIVGIALAVFACQADHRMPTKIATLDNLGGRVRGHQCLTRRDEVAIGVPLAVGGLSRVSPRRSLLAHRRGLASPGALRRRWGWSSLIGWLALIMRASQQVISAPPENRRNLDEQLCTRLLFALLNLGEMLAWLSQPPCQLTL